MLELWRLGRGGGTYLCGIKLKRHLKIAQPRAWHIDDDLKYAFRPLCPQQELDPGIRSQWAKSEKLSPECGAAPPSQLRPDVLPLPQDYCSVLNPRAVKKEASCGEKPPAGVVMIGEEGPT